MIRGASFGERGAALMSVLLLVAVMAALAALSLDRLRLATRLGGGVAAMDQARAFALAGEAVALRRVPDLRRARAADWAGRVFPMPVPGGSGTARLDDGGTCFNLNSLVAESAPGQLTQRPRAVAQFAALMRLSGVNDGEAAAIAAATADWIDSDSIPGPLGAEDEAYRSAATPYLTANQPMADVSELLAVRGVTPALFARLAPLLCALPSTDPTRINVNALAPAQAALVAMLDPDQLNPAQVRAALAARPRDGFGSALRFWESGPLRGVDPPDDVAQQIIINAEWISMDMDIILGDSRFAAWALIDARQDGAARAPYVAARRWGFGG